MVLLYLEEAARWFLKSAEQGYARAELAYGFTFRLANPSVAEKWMRRAAEQGDTEAEFWLRCGYGENWFGAVDIQEAIKWYRKAAEGGNPDAQVELGRRYEDGEGLEQNYTLAVERLRNQWKERHALSTRGSSRN